MFDKIMRLFNRKDSGTNTKPVKNNYSDTTDTSLDYDFKPPARIVLEDCKITVPVPVSISDLPNNIVVKVLSTLDYRGLRDLILCNKGLAEKLYYYFEDKFFTVEEEEWDELEEGSSEEEILDELFLKVPSPIVKKEILKIFGYKSRVATLVAEAEKFVTDVEKS